MHLLFFYVDKYKDFINIKYVYQGITKYIKNTNITFRTIRVLQKM